MIFRASLGSSFTKGKLEEFKRLSAQCLEIVRTKDTGTLQYEIYFSNDQSECIVVERYRDSDGLTTATTMLDFLPPPASLARRVESCRCRSEAGSIRGLLS